MSRMHAKSDQIETLKQASLLLFGHKVRVNTKREGGGRVCVWYSLNMLQNMRDFKDVFSELYWWSYHPSVRIWRYKKSGSSPVYDAGIAKSTED